MGGTKEANHGHHDDNAIISARTAVAIRAISCTIPIRQVRFKNYVESATAHNTVTVDKGRTSTIAAGADRILGLVDL